MIDLHFWVSGFTLKKVTYYLLKARKTYLPLTEISKAKKKKKCKKQRQTTVAKTKTKQNGSSIINGINIRK